METNRLNILSRAFTEVGITIAGQKLRPLTAGVVMVLIDTKNPLFAPEETEQPANANDESKALQGIFEFLYLLAAPIEDVERVMDDREALARAARRFSLTVPLEDLGRFTGAFQDIQLRLAAASVETKPDRSMGKPAAAQMPPPTGSPPTSTPLADPAILSASATSSGISPFPGGSNTSTPPNSIPENPCAGSTRIWPDSPPATSDSTETEPPPIPLP